MTAKIIVAAHKPYWMPSDDVYMPMQVGAAGKDSIGFARDDEGDDNISARNANWCELTGLYWAWRNIKADAIGLVHYRRHFRGGGDRKVATGREIAALLAENDVILPKKRNYFIETTYSQYAHAHHGEDLDQTRAIIARRYPEFLDAFDATMASPKGHRFNMFVMKRPLFDEYCAWMFDILMELEKTLDISSYSAYDARVFGFIGERLLDVWLAAKGISAMAELPVLHLESQHWPTKIVNFLMRKIKHR